MEVTQKIPGGWHGNDPGAYRHDPKLGNVVINAKRTVDAITWLRRRALIISTEVHQDGGLHITYRKR